MGTARLTEALIASLPIPEKGNNKIYYDSEVKGFAVRITSTGFRSFLMCYVMDAREHRMPIGEWLKGAGMIAQARERAAALRLQIQSGADPALEKKLAAQARERERQISAKEVSFERVAQRYIAEHASRKKSGFADVRRINKHLLPAWSSRKAKDITRADVYALIEPVAAGGLRAEANLRLALIRKIFSFCVDVGILDQHPCLRMKSPGGRIDARDRALTSQRELRTFWRITDGGRWAKLVPESERNALRLMLLTGCRPSEAAELNRSEIDFVQGLWHLPAERSKNKRAHVIPLVPEAMDIVRSQCARSTNEYVFKGARSAHITQNSLSRALRAVSRRLKRIGLVPFAPHDLRRTVETGMVMSKVGKEHRDRVLNHIDNSVGGRHYNKYEYLEEKRAALLAWRDKLESLLSESTSVVVPLRRQLTS